MQEKQWQYGMTIVFGLLLLAMPWLLHFAQQIPIRSWDFVLVGVVTVACALAGMHLRSVRASYVAPALGIWMFVSPWVLGFVSNVEARNSAWALGALVFLMSLWALLERRVLARRAVVGSAQQA
jgi:hypothetical protein